MLAIFCFVFSLMFVQTAGLEYGKYRVEILNFTQCKTAGMDKTPMTSNVTWVKYPNGTDSLHVTAVVRKLLGPFGMRIKVMKQDPVSYKYVSIVNQKIKNMCEGDMGREIVRILPLLGKNCTASEGNFIFAVSDFDGMMHKLIGNQFFLGSYQYHFDLTTARSPSSYICTKTWMTYAPAE